MELDWKDPPGERDPGSYGEGNRWLAGGEVREWAGPSAEVLSPVYSRSDGRLERRRLGESPMLDAGAAREALAAARSAYDNGRGDWPASPVSDRISCMEDFLERMEARRLECVRLLCWEVAKPWDDAAAEFDRTVACGHDTISALKELDRAGSRLVWDSGYLAQLRRAPVGVALCAGPYNYPLNESLCTLLPALLMGNTTVLKLPRPGALCVAPLLDALAEAFPPGTVNVVCGDDGTVAAPLLETGDADLLAFMGTAAEARALERLHPRPHRLRKLLALEAKNPAVVMGDADLAAAAAECAAGALAFNGQRRTAIRLVFVDEGVAEDFAARLCDAVAALKAGMPFEDGVALTPLADPAAAGRMAAYVEDASFNGAKVLNQDGGAVDRTYFHPAVVYPVRPGMRLWDEEQAGPIVAVAPAKDPFEAVVAYLAGSAHGQQASVFGRDPELVGPLIDLLANLVCRVNLNGRCRRGPDSFPFGGRKDSGEGALSVAGSLEAFSMRALVAAQDSEENVELVRAVLRERTSRFLTTDHIF